MEKSVKKNTNENKTSVWTNDIDLVLAISPWQASNIMQKRCGCDGYAGHTHDKDQLWERVKSTKMIHIYGVSAKAEKWASQGSIGRLGDANMII